MACTMSRSMTQRPSTANKMSRLTSSVCYTRSNVIKRPLMVQAIFGKLFGAKNTTNEAPVRPKRETVVPQPSFNLPLSLIAIAGVSGYEGNIGLAAFTGLLGVFLTVQATRVKFVFDDEALEVVIAGKEEKETENAFVGGRNRWRYDTFINWELWWPGFPVLVYFKESQTKPEGQIHFFPVIFDGKQLYDVMVERCPKALPK